MSKFAIEELRISIPEACVLQNEWDRMHHHAKKRLMQRYAWLLLKALGGKPKKPIQRCVVSYTRYSSRLPDWLGLYGGLKPLEDAMVVPTQRNPNGIGLIQDDSPKHIVNLSAMPEKCKRGEEKTDITILVLDDE